MKQELSSGIFESLRARCARCGKSIAEHCYCESCGRPRRCDDEAGWIVNDAEPPAARCPTCEFAEAV